MSLKKLNEHKKFRWCFTFVCVILSGILQAVIIQGSKVKLIVESVL